RPLGPVENDLCAGDRPAVDVQHLPLYRCRGLRAGPNHCSGYRRDCETAETCVHGRTHIAVPCCCSAARATAKKMRERWPPGCPSCAKQNSSSVSDEKQGGGDVPSEPGAHADEEFPAPRILSRGSSEIGRRAGLSLPPETDIGRELAFDLVAQPQAALDRAQAGPLVELRNSLRREVELDPRLQHDALTNSEVVLGLESSGDVALVGYERRSVDLEDIRQHALKAEHGMR